MQPQHGHIKRRKLECGLDTLCGPKMRQNDRAYDSALSEHVRRSGQHGFNCFRKWQVFFSLSSPASLELIHAQEVNDPSAIAAIIQRGADLNLMSTPKDLADIFAFQAASEMRRGSEDGELICRATETDVQ